jgi:hypothetical protein
MNSVAQELTGWTHQEASSMPVTEVFHIVNEQTRDEVENPVVKVLREGMMVGLAADITDKMFDPFFTTKGLGEGTGLGLSVVHGIMKQHDGYITVESEPGRGSTFTAYIPQILYELEADAVSDIEIPTGSERILFVDDEEALVEISYTCIACSFRPAQKCPLPMKESDRRGHEYQGPA